MIFNDFIKKYTGKPVDFDGVYPNQCMDLMHQYAYEVLGITDVTVLAKPSAYQVFTEFRWDNLFKKIPNTPDGVPEKGDILIFGPLVGAFGHVCIVTEASVYSFKSFDANWPVGSLPHIQSHDYTGVLGWLRFCVAISPTSPQDAPEIDNLKKTIDSLTSQKELLLEAKNRLEIKISETKRQIKKILDS